MKCIYKKVEDNYSGVGEFIYENERGTKYIYIGEILNGKRHGHGVSIYKSGAKYDGEYKDDKMHGHGVFTYEKNIIGINGNVIDRKYDGEWKEGYRHGHGIYTYSCGNEYDGEWKYGDKHGHGVLTWVDWNIYDGEWKGNRRHGHGVETYVDGRKYYGKWKRSNNKETYGGLYLGTKNGIFKLYDKELFQYEYYINDKINKEKTEEFNKKIEKLRLTKILSKYFGGDCYASEMLKSIGY